MYWQDYKDNHLVKFPSWRGQKMKRLSHHIYWRTRSGHLKHKKPKKEGNPKTARRQKLQTHSTFRKHPSLFYSQSSPKSLLIHHSLHSPTSSLIYQVRIKQVQLQLHIYVVCAYVHIMVDCVLVYSLIDCFGRCSSPAKWRLR